MAISTRLRYEVLRRDGFTCRYCGAAAPDARLEVDHVVPVALGGTDEPSNLTTACGDCNAGKSSATPEHQTVDEVDDSALRWSRAMARAAEVQAQDVQRRRAYVEKFDAAWEAWTFSDGSHTLRPADYAASVGRWFECGLEIEVLCDLVDDVLMRSIPNGRMWRYFCGAVRNVLQQRAELARELLDAGQVD